MRRTIRLPLLLLVFYGLTLPGAAGKPTPLPFPLLLDVDYGGPAEGPASWRREMEGWLIQSLADDRCYESVRLLREDNPIERYMLARIRVEEYDEQQTYDVNQATLHDPDNENPAAVQRAFTLRAEAGFEVIVTAIPEEAILRSRRFRLTSAYRPTFDEDARYTVRFQLVEDVYKVLRGMVCGWNEKKLERELARGSATPGE